MDCWSSDRGDLREDPASIDRIIQLPDSWRPKSVVSLDRIIGCPHEEGMDYPDDEACPQCPFWETSTDGRGSQSNEAVVLSAEPRIRQASELIAGATAIAQDHPHDMTVSVEVNYDSNARGPALTATLAEGEFAPTLELKINFVAPAKVGGLMGYGRIVARGGSVCVLEGERHQDGQLIAKASATALVIKTR